MKNVYHLFLITCAIAAGYSVPARAEVYISEFMAVNDTLVQDEDGDRSDWIELYNSSSNAVNLGGWHLTDKADDLSKWTFPPVTLGPNDFLIVWASNKNRKDPDEELHTNFKLSGSGEYLALVKPDEQTIAHHFAPTYPEQANDVSWGFNMGPESATNISVVAGQSPVRVLVPTDDSLDYDHEAGIIPWTLQGFDDSAWTAGSMGVGYERLSRYDPLINLDVESSMYYARVGIYTRATFALPEEATITHAELKLKYDDGFIAYLNGELIDEKTVEVQ